MPVPPRARRISRWLGAVAAAAALATAVVPAAAAPAPTRADVERLGDQVSRLDEELNQARIELRRLEQLAGQVRQAAEAEGGRLAGLRRSLGAKAVSQYKGGAVGSIASLLAAEDSATVVARAATLDLLARHDGDLLASTLAQQRALATATGEVAEAEAAERAEVGRIAARKAELQRKLAELGRLRSRVGEPGSAPVPAALPPAKGAAAAAVRTALAQVGKPYHWGGGGPGAFDCSGLTMYSWAAAGVPLPHSSQAQYQSLPHVARHELQPGDLVFFGSPIHHVGLYVGSGRMVDAPSSGRVVQVRGIDRSDYAGAGRP